mgnify:CR=1 FL=1
MASSNHRDTYKAASFTFIVFGILYLADKILHFSSLGIPWIMHKDNFLLYTAIIFLLFKQDKSVGLILSGLWIVLNFSLIAALIGSASAYMLPLALLLLGGAMYWLSTK